MHRYDNRFMEFLSTYPAEISSYEISMMKVLKSNG